MPNSTPSLSPAANRHRDPRQQLRAAWHDRDALATTLVVLLLDQYGTEACNWSPITIRSELADDLHVELPEANLHRLMAGIRLVTTDDFYQNLPAFNELCVILADDGYHDPESFVPASAAACAWGLTEALLLAPPDPRDGQPFTEDIRAYLGQVLSNEGILTPPDILRLALHDPKLAENIRYDFADDPDMFNAIFDAEASKTSSINQFVKGRLRHLLGTLRELPLQHGDVRSLAAKLLSTLPEPESAD